MVVAKNVLDTQFYDVWDEYTPTLIVVSIVAIKGIELKIEFYVIHNHFKSKLIWIIWIASYMRLDKQNIKFFWFTTFTIWLTLYHRSKSLTRLVWDPGINVDYSFGLHMCLIS